MIDALLEAGASTERRHFDPEAAHPDHGRMTAIELAYLQGDFEAVRLLSSYGADRQRVHWILDQDPEYLPVNFGNGSQIANWLRRSRGWSPLHHLETLSVRRAAALLRAGADVHASAHWQGFSPLQLARHVVATAATSPRDAPDPRREAAELLVRAAAPWSPPTHALWPDAYRVRAIELTRLGWLLSRTPSFCGEEGALCDVWLSQVVPRVLAFERGTKWRLDDDADAQGDGSSEDDDVAVEERLRRTRGDGRVADGIVSRLWTMAGSFLGLI